MFSKDTKYFVRKTFICIFQSTGEVCMVSHYNLSQACIRSSYGNSVTTLFMHHNVENKINEEKQAASFMNDFLGPAGGFFCLLLNIQSAILAVILTGFTIPWIDGEKYRFFGWRYPSICDYFIKL